MIIFSGMDRDIAKDKPTKGIKKADFLKKIE